jgi:hypothetical protein
MARPGLARCYHHRWRCPPGSRWGRSAIRSGSVTQTWISPFHAPGRPARRGLSIADLLAHPYQRMTPHRLLEDHADRLLRSRRISAGFSCRRSRPSKPMRSDDPAPAAQARSCRSRPTCLNSRPCTLGLEGEGGILDRVRGPGAADGKVADVCGPRRRASRGLSASPALADEVEPAPSGRWRCREDAHIHRRWIRAPAPIETPGTWVRREPRNDKPLSSRMALATTSWRAR